MKKKLIALILSLALFLSAGLTATVSVSAKTEAEDAASYTAMAATKVAAIQIGIPQAFVNGKKTMIDTKNKKVVPIKKGGRTLVPLRFCATAMGGKTKYISDKEYITVTLGDKIAKFKINSKTLQIVDSKGKVLKKVALDVAATKINGRVQVPLRAISEGLSCKVAYKKVWSDEYIVVSQERLDESDQIIEMARLQNLNKYTVKKYKGYTVTLAKAWKEYDEYGILAVENPLYPYHYIIIDPISVREAKQLMGYSQNELEKYLDQWAKKDGWSAYVSDFVKTEINGKKALFYTEMVISPDNYDWIETSYCIITSNNAALRCEITSHEDQIQLSELNEFRRICKTIQFTK